MTPEVKERPESPLLVRGKERRRKTASGKIETRIRPGKFLNVAPIFTRVWSSSDLRKPAVKPQHDPPHRYVFHFSLLCRSALISAWNVATHSASVSGGTRRSISPKKFLNQRCNYCPPYAQTQLDLRWLDKQMLPDSYKL